MSTFSKLRVGKKGVSAGSVKLIAKISVDPTAVSSNTGYTLPAGATVIGVASLGGATGGITPTIDVGTSTTADAFANELSASTAGAGTTGAGCYTKLTTNTPVYAGVGASAATGGTTTFILEYFLDDPRNGANG